jgi:hypothetical protein
MNDPFFDIFVDGMLLEVSYYYAPNLFRNHPDKPTGERHLIKNIRTPALCILLEQSYSRTWDSKVGLVLTPYGIGWINLKYCELCKH